MVDQSEIFTAFCDATAGAENIALGSSNSPNEAAVSAWYSEVPPNDGHKKNMLNPAYHQTGVGSYTISGKTWYVQDFMT